jgi:GT2 family glycosyltransferase
MGRVTQSTSVEVALEGISIVIPTYRRVKYLGVLLEALSISISKFDCPTETLLLDDTPEPEQQQVEDLAKRYHCRYIRSPKSINKKRNLGISESQYQYILFLDSDCEPTPDLLNQHWKSLTSSPNVGGCLGLLTFSGPDSWFWDVIELTPFVLPFNWPKFDKSVPWGPTANMSFLRRALVEVDGFDETFPLKPGGEDVDLGLRITGSGYQIITNVDAEVFHTKETWNVPTVMMKRLYTWGRADYELYIRHKDRVFLQFPRILLLTLILLILSAPLAFLLQSDWVLLFPTGWFLLNLVLQAALQDRRFRHNKPKNLFKQMAGILLTFCDEAGFSLNCIQHGDWKALLYKMRYTDGQQIGEWHYGVVRIWTASIGIMVLTLIIGLLY